jgi:CBS domain-containing protein
MSFEDIKGEKKEEKVVRIEPLAVDMAIDLITAAPEETLCKVAELMINHGVDTILIVEGDKLVGIVTSKAMFALISVRVILKRTRFKDLV